jgi:hypothetical protein
MPTISVVPFVLYPVSKTHFPVTREPRGSLNLDEADAANEAHNRVPCAATKPLATHPTIKKARALIRPYERCRPRSPRSRWVGAQRHREAE